MVLAEYNYTLTHIAGITNVVADAMSRCLKNPKAELEAEMKSTTNLETKANLFRMINSIDIPAPSYKLIAQFHNSQVGHYGFEHTLRMMKQNGHQWKHLRAHIRKFIHDCPMCQKMSPLLHEVSAARFTTASYEPFARISMDTMGPLPETSEGHQFILVIIDCFTRILELYPCKSTEADEAADAVISAGLRASFPDVTLITEEQADSHALSARTFLIVDPLDGTKEFVQRRGDFTVNIAYVENGIPLRGVVYAPAQGRLFYTQADGRSVEETGAFGKAAAGPLRPLAVSTPDNAALMVVASKSHRDQATDDYIARYAVRDMTSAGSSLKFCLVATGEADLYPRLGRTMEWDTAAGDAVLRGAGGQVVRFDDHTALRYGKPGWENPFFIAFAPGVDLQE
jgi:3'(2'), 5'-bisphosphate nucleotidase